MAPSDFDELVSDLATARDALALALDASNSGLWIWDLKTDRLAWSPEVYAIFGVEDFHLTLENFFTLIHPEDVQKGQEVWGRALADGSILTVQFRRLWPDGSVKWLSNTGRARYDAKGVAYQFIGTVRELPDQDSADAFYDASFRPERGARGRAPLIERLKQLRGGLSGAPTPDAARRAGVEESILEFLLCSVAPAAEARALAHALLQRFGSAAEVFAAPPDILCAVGGVEERHLVLLDVVRLSIQFMLQPTREPVRFENETAIVNYLRIAQAYKSREQLRVLFLDRARHIIGDEVMQEGTVDYTPVYVREIVKRALELSASSLILAHNHPSGDPTPSSKDIVTTLKIVEIARSLGIEVDDHIIMSKHGHTSMRAMKIIRDAEAD